MLRSPSDATAGPGSLDKGGARGWYIVATCLLLMMVDGFDNQAIGFVAPEIAREWGLTPSLLGPVFSAGLFGALIGSITFGTLGDRFGNLRMVLLSIGLISLGSLATFWATDLLHLLLLRGLTGLGLGGALPNLIAMAAAHAPDRYRATTVSVVIVGIPLGAGLGGFMAAELILTKGWQAVFLVGALLPLPLAVLLIFLVHGERPASRMGHGSPMRGARGTLRLLLMPAHRRTTILLWMSMVLGGMLTYTITAWLPTLLTQRQFDLRFAVWATSLLNLGAVFGGAALGRMIDAWGPKISLTLAYFLGAIAIAMIGAVSAEALVMAMVFFTALFALGGNTGLGAIASTYYPADLRATGVGASLAAARIGAVCGPLLISLLLASEFSVPSIFYFGGLVALLVGLLVPLLARSLRPDADIIG